MIEDIHSWVDNEKIEDIYGLVDSRHSCGLLKDIVEPQVLARSRYCTPTKVSVLDNVKLLQCAGGRFKTSTSITSINTDQSWPCDVSLDVAHHCAMSIPAWKKSTFIRVGKWRLIRGGIFICGCYRHRKIFQPLVHFLLVGSSNYHCFATG